MNLDLNHVQAFVAAADALHFGRAARQLHLTQQGLSHRVTRLEQVLGERLFLRDGRTVELTAAGRRFLPHARHLLAVANAAIAETREARAPLRVDVWGQLQAPLRWIGRLPAIDRQIPLEISMRRNAAAAIEAFDRDEIDAAFCLPPNHPLPAGLRHAPVGIEPMGALVSPGHALVGRDTIAASDLHGQTLWIPGTGTDPVVLSYYRQLAAHFGLSCDESGSNLGLHYLLARLDHRPDRILALPRSIDPRFVPITDPTPYMAWTMLWRSGNRDEDLATLRSALRRVAAVDAPAEWDPATCWLPAADLAYLQQARPVQDFDNDPPR